MNLLQIEIQNRRKISGQRCQKSIIDVIVANMQNGKTIDRWTCGDAFPWCSSILELKYIENGFIVIDIDAL